jgi:hypothetical protein
MSMVLIAISTTYIFLQHIELFFPTDKHNFSNKNQKIIHIVVMTYFTLLLTICGLHWENIFNGFFGLFLFSLVIYMCLIERNNFRLEIPDKIVKQGWKGVLYILASCIFWIVTEIGCNYITVFKYVFGHVWWHVFISYGGYLISLIPVYLDMGKICNTKCEINEDKADYDNNNGEDYNNNVEDCEEFEKIE